MAAKLLRTVAPGWEAELGDVGCSSPRIMTSFDAAPDNNPLDHNTLSPVLGLP